MKGTGKNKPDLFMHGSAHFSSDRKFRYWLERRWDFDKPLILFIGLNPSTANETDNDPTIGRVIDFAKAWGYGGVYMMNLFPLVSKEPQDLLAFYETPFFDLEQENNTNWLQIKGLDCKDVLFAWGAFKQAKGAAQIVAKMFPKALALHINKDGSPKHPLYVKGTTAPIQYRSL